jgi:uncharacterized Zn finger protein
MSKCPEPSAEQESDMETLELIWFEVERISPHDLSHLLPLVDKYAKKEFQRFNLYSLDRLFDSLQSYFPDQLLQIYYNASEILATNMQPKQYQQYADFLKVFARRCNELNKQAEWAAFVGKVRREQARKKKLIQIMNVDEIK